MKILTPFPEEKSDTLFVPLVDNEQLNQQARTRRLSAATTLCVLLITLVVISIGVIGGNVLYNKYNSFTREQRYEDLNLTEDAESASFEPLMPLSEEATDQAIPTPMTWFLHIFGDMPQRTEKLRSPRAAPTSDSAEMTTPTVDDEVRIDDANPSSNMKDGRPKNDPSIHELIASMNFKEKLEINFDKKYEKIDVPDVADGRHLKFIHDFKTNTTGIVDFAGQRCFVKPLENVLPPKSLYDQIYKARQGYYKVDTSMVRRTMRVVIPPITDTKSISCHIVDTCQHFPIYRLEKYDSGIIKRSAEPRAVATFAHFAGMGIEEVDIINMKDVIQYEKELKLSNNPFTY